MKQSTKCICGKEFSKDKNLCSCGIYRVNEDNYDKSYKEIYGNTTQE